jgi:hypothetical protein
MSAAETHTDPAADPVGLLGQLSADTIRARMAELDAQRQALAVLLRAASARERAMARRQAPAAQERGRHAS